MRARLACIGLYLLAGCGPPQDLLSRAPYCAVPGPCETDDQCLNRYTLSEPEVTCDRGDCVIAYRCREDADCEAGATCRFVSTVLEGIGEYSCGLDRAADDGTTPTPAPSGACLVEGCGEGQDCIELTANRYACLRRCAFDLDCGVLGPGGDDNLCFEGYCLSVPCVDGADFGCGFGLECRNSLPPRVF